MEIRSSFCILVLSLFVTSCVTMEGIGLRQSPPNQNGGINGGNPQNNQQNNVGSDAPDQNELLSRKEEKSFRPKLGLILGPGLAKTFAHIGILKRMREANIPVKMIVGMGWGSLPAAEYASEDSVHGLEWKVSRSEKLRSLKQTSFWSRGIQAKGLEQSKALVNGLLTSGKKADSFGCPVMMGPANRLRLLQVSGLNYCISVPPLFDSGSKVAPYLYEIDWITRRMRKEGVEKVIFINVLPKGTASWKMASAKLSNSPKWYWNFVEEELSKESLDADHILEIPLRSHGLMDFEDALEIIRSGYRAGARLIELLQTEYQF